MSDISICNGRPKPLSPGVIRAGWEAERPAIRQLLLERKFTPKAVDKAANNFIESAVFAGIVCTSRDSILAMFARFSNQYERE